MKRFLLGLATVAVTGTAAMSDIICMKTAELEAGLIDWYGEMPVHHMNATTVLWKSEKMGTWTVVEKRTNGVSCTIDAGDRTDTEVLSDELFAALD